MAEYIEREALIEFVKNNTPNFDGETTMQCVKRAIKEAPAADVVEVCRCGQCRHATEDIIVEGVCYCHKIQQGMFLDGFCSYGEGRNTK